MPIAKTVKFLIRSAVLQIRKWMISWICGLFAFGTAAIAFIQVKLPVMN